MDTFLTLVIAVGGIATGIGAIWTAMLARRQLSEQRQFLKEQNEIARRQARVTERSLTEQNERARLTLEFDLLTRLGERFESPRLLSRRRAAAEYLLENAFAGEEPPALNRAATEVVIYFEELGNYTRSES